MESHLKNFEFFCDEVAKKKETEKSFLVVSIVLEAKNSPIIKEIAELYAAEVAREKVKEAIPLIREKMANDHNGFSSFVGSQFYKYTEEEILNKLGL